MPPRLLTTPRLIATLAALLVPPPCAALAATGGTPAAEVRGPATEQAWWSQVHQLMDRQAFVAAEAELTAAARTQALGGAEADRVTYWLGWCQRRTEQPRRALATLGAVPAASRWHVKAMEERAAIQRSLGDDDAAIGLYEQLLPLLGEGRKDTARAALADLYFTSGQYPRAQALYLTLANTYGPHQERSMFAWGWTLLRVKQEDAAVNIWKQALEKFPVSRYAQAVRLALGNLMWARGDHLSASTYYNEAARQGRQGQAGPDLALMARAELLAGEAYADDKDYGLAISHYRAVPDDSPLHEPAAYATAWATWQQGKFAEAQGLFQAWLERYPRSNYRPAALYGLGIVERSLGHEAAGLEHLRQVPRVAPRSGWAEDALYVLTRAAFRARDGEQAVAQGRKLELQFPRSRWLGPVLWMRGETHLAAGDWGDAVRAYTQLSVLGNLAFLAGQAEEVDYKLGLAHFYAGNHAEAARVLEGVTAGALGADATFWAAEARQRLGQHDSARALLQRLLAGHPGHPKVAESWYGLGWSCQQLGDLTAARAAYREATRRLPEGRMRQDATYRLGLVLIELKAWEEARNTLRRLLETQVPPPRVADARFQIAWTLYRQDRHAEAAEAFGAVAALPGAGERAARALLWQGRSLFLLKRLPEAIEALKRATEHPAATPRLRQEANQQLAAAHFNSGAYDEARQIYEDLLAQGDLPPEQVSDLRHEVVQALLKAGRFAQARTELLKGGPPREADQATWLDIARGQRDQRAWDEVIETQRSCGEASPPQLRLWAGQALVEKKNWADARAVLGPLRASGDAEVRTLAQLHLAQAARGAGDLAEARSQLVALADSQPAAEVGAQALREAAEVAREQQETAVAQTLLRRLAETRAYPAERRQQAWMDLGDAHRAAKQWGLALLAYRGARGLGQPGTLGVALGGYWAGSVLVEMRQFKEAVRELSSIRVPEGAEPLPALVGLKQGEALEQLERWREAADLYARLARGPASPESKDAKDRLAWILEHVPPESRR
ncbi:MAG: tetratricopeptide repeat protein [Candidatus Sericytochromatia bacterium]|nr:tetratricopeptide repeat protein [Candidatus Sericytochromatia bacterium]